jgi:hypothetical protein
MTRRHRILLVLCASAIALTGPVRADGLADGFANPPQSARPRVWWHWLNGNVTKDGIDKDLDWMARVGIGGVQNFDANLMTPQIVPERLVYMTDPWKDAFRHAVHVADAKGLEFAIAASPGWSETGGPWVTPADAMKKLVWSQIDVAGGRPIGGPIARPPEVTGPFQSAGLFDPLQAGPAEAKAPTYYADVALLAFPIARQPLPAPKLFTADGAPVDAAAATDASLETGSKLPIGADGHPSLLLDYGRAVTVRSATLFVPRARPPFGEPAFRPVLEAEQDGRWQTIGALTLATVPTTIGFAPVTARRFRIVFAANPDAGMPALGDFAPGALSMDIFPKSDTAALTIGDLRLSAEPRVDHFEEKAGFAVALDYCALGEGVADVPAVDPSQVVDLTGRLRADGTLDWTPPRGSDWRIVRMGMSLTGKTNHPATAEATGLEVDKYDAGAVRRYLETYLGQYRDIVGKDWIGARGIRALLTDSIEVGPSNWTPDMIAAFTKRRGYDPRPWLPALTGAVIGSAAKSDAFLADFRQTLADLLAEAHYGTVAAVAHEHGLKLYGEALEDKRPVLGDDMAMRRNTDVPMAALWTFGRDGKPRTTLLGDMKGAASVAHIYGQNIVAAESMTSMFSPWAFAPADLKRVIDLEFAYGINRPVIHTSVHQPVDDKVPGLSLMIFGQYFNRHDSWAEMAKPWVDYMARSSFLLQQGRNQADLAYFAGEDSPLTALFAAAPPADLPTRYAYDFVDADVLAHRLSVDGGELVAVGGVRYKALYLGLNSRRMTRATLQAVAKLVEQGALVIGMPPEGSPSLADDPADFRALIARLWSGAPVTQVGQGRVVASRAPETALAAAGIGPDVSIAGPQPGSNYLFVHRKLDDGDIYYVNNRRPRAERIEARFRVTGRQPELWRAMTGTAEPVSYRIEGGETVVPIEAGPEDAFFVVFRKPATATSAIVQAPELHPVATLDAPWIVAFQPGRGAPAGTVLPALAPLERSNDAGIRYFSGIATYTTRFSLPKAVKPGQQLWIDLGQVGDVAEVRVNGQPAGTGWFAPYRIDIGKLVKRGANDLEVRVANLWVNRLIGDQQPGATKITFTAAPTYRPDAPLRPSGLIGPVRLMAGE